MNDNCIFCKIVAGSIPATKVYEDSTVLAFKDIHPKASTHILIIPKEHFVHLGDMRPEHADLLAHIMLTAPKIAAEQQLKGFRVVINNGPEGGQEVPHLHLHILGGTTLPKF